MFTGMNLADVPSDIIYHIINADRKPWRFVDELRTVGCIKVEFEVRVAVTSFHTLSRNSDRWESVWNKEMSIFFYFEL